MGCGGSVQKGTAPAKYETDSGTKKEEEAYKKIHSAVRWDKLIECKKIITTPEAANINDPVNGNKPIHIASQNGHMEVVKFLIETGADINLKNGKGNTAIHMAVGYDYYHIAKLLLDKGADPNATNDAGFLAIRGLEGDKSMAFAKFVSALNGKELMDALNDCEANIECLNKVAFAGCGLRLKKNLRSEWTPEIQSKFKSITQKL